jgi:hypothetical protein
MAMFSTHCWGASIVAAIIPPNSVRLKSSPPNSNAIRLSREVWSRHCSDLAQVNNANQTNAIECRPSYKDHYRLQVQPEVCQVRCRLLLTRLSLFPNF